MNFIAVPTKEYEKHEKLVQEICQDCVLTDIRLQNTREIPKLKPVYTWQPDKTNIVNTCAEFYKLMNSLECTDADYIKPTKPIMKDRELHKASIRETIRKSIRELM